MLLLMLGCTPANVLTASSNMPFELGEMQTSLFVSEYSGDRGDRADGFILLSNKTVPCSDLLVQNWRWDDEKRPAAGETRVVLDIDWNWWPHDWREDTQPPGSLGWAGLYGQSIYITESVGDGVVRRDFDLTFWHENEAFELYEATGLLTIEGIEGGAVQATLDHTLMSGRISAKNCGEQESEGEDSGYYYY